MPGSSDLEEVGVFASLFFVQQYSKCGPKRKPADRLCGPGLILATTFVSFPFVAREMIPVMEATGRKRSWPRWSGASGWQMFFRVTLPNIKWGLLYGVILCNARAMGEFGAVSVVSGQIRGPTNTLPLQWRICSNEYNFQAAFAVASLLALLALVTLVLKTLAEGQAGHKGPTDAGHRARRPTGQTKRTAYNDGH